MTGDDDADGTVDRRTLLQYLGAGAVMSGLAGCQDVTDREFAAVPAGLSEAGMEVLGFAEGRHRRDRQTRSVGVGDAAVDVTVTSHLVTYGADGPEQLPETWDREAPEALSVGVLSTPAAVVGGSPRNPLATAGLDDIVEGEAGGRLLRATDAVEEAPEWDRPPERVGPAAATLLGADVEVASYLGRTAGGVQVLIHLARTERARAAADEEATATDDGGTDTVVVAGVETRAGGNETFQERAGCLDEQCTLTRTDLDRLHERITGAIETVTVCPRTAGLPDADECREVIPGGGSTGPVPDLDVSNVRLVQTVEDTRLVGGSTSYTVPDPDLVAGANATVVFDASVSNVEEFPAQTTVEVEWVDGDGRHADSYAIPKAQVRAIDRGIPVVAVLHRLAHVPAIGSNPTVFEVADDLRRVELSAGWNVGSSGEVAILEEGADFDVSTVPTLRVGFVQLWDRSGGDRYGDANGQPMEFRATVDRAVEYIKRVVPGHDLTAYRAEEIVSGRSKSANDDQDYYDMKATKTAMDQLLGHETVADGAADVVEHSRSSARAAFRDLRANGFDVVVCVVPGDDTTNPGATHYFDYHTGKPNLRGRRYGKKAAVGVLEAGDPSVTLVSTSGTTAMEIAHHFVDDPYEGPSSGGLNHPMAQRDDDDTDVDISGSPAGIDFDHARHTTSNNPGKIGYADLPGVVSKGYDLVDGTFALVNYWEFDSSGDFDVSTIDAPFSHENLDSYMSYTPSDDEQWTDSRLHQHLIDGGFAPNHSGGPLDVLSAVGTVDGERRVQFDAVSAYRGYPVAEAVDEGHDGGVATVELLDPAGEVRHGERVSTVVEVSEGSDVEGVVDVVAPFPETAVSVRTVVDDVETRLNPVVASVRDAVGRLDERAVAEGSEELRRAVEERLDGVAALMADGEYLEAADAMGGVRELAASELRATDGVALNVVTRDELVDLAGRMVERLEVAAEVA